MRGDSGTRDQAVDTISNISKVFFNNDKSSHKVSKTFNKIKGLVVDNSILNSKKLFNPN